jgi:hypothetical protein
MKWDLNLDFEFLSDLVKNHLDMQVDTNNFKRLRGKKWLTSEGLEELFVTDNLFLESAKQLGEYLSVSRKDRVICFGYCGQSQKPRKALLEKYLNDDRFVVAMEYPGEFVEFQGESTISNFEVFGVDYSMYKVVEIPYYPYKKIDTSVNPGRLQWSNAHEMYIGAVWRMWLSAEFRSLYSGKLPESFEQAWKKEHLENDVLFLQLYEDPEDSLNPKVLSILQAYRDWVGIDKLLEDA